MQIPDIDPNDSYTPEGNTVEGRAIRQERDKRILIEIVVLLVIIFVFFCAVYGMGQSTAMASLTGR